MSRELLLRRDRPTGDQSLACDEPAKHSKYRQSEQRLDRAVAREWARGWDRARHPVRPRAEEPEEFEESDHPGPEGEPAAIRTKRWRKSDVSSPASREEVDRCCQ